MKKGLLLLMIVLSIPRARAEESNLSCFGIYVDNKNAEDGLQARAGLRLS